MGWRGALGGGWEEGKRRGNVPGWKAQVRVAQAGDGVVLVADDQDGHVLDVSTLGDLLAEHADVAETLEVGQVEDEYVGVGVAQPVAPEVAPLDVAVDREVRDGGHVGDAQLVDAVVEYRRRVVDALRLRRPVLVAEMVPHELLPTTNASH